MFVSTAAKAKRSLKRVKDPVIRERLLMVKAGSEKPLREAAAGFGCTHGKIDFWVKRFEKFGLRGLKTKNRPGRPRQITDEQEIVLKQTVQKKNLRGGWRTKHVRELIRKEAGVKYSERHTIRVLQRWGMSRLKPRPRYAYSKESDRKQFLKKPRATWHASKNLGES